MAKTTHFNLEKPDTSKDVDEEFYQLQTTLDMLDSILKSLQDLVNTKAAGSHTHTIDNIVGLASALSDKMSATQTFSLDNLTNVSGANDAANGYILVKQALGWLPSSPAAALGTHGHTIAQITGLVDQLAAKADASATSTALASKADASAVDASLALKADKSLIDALVLSGATPSLDLVLTEAGGFPGTFSRASTGTYFDVTGVMRTAAIDEPRFDYDPATGEPRGLLIEPTATNRLLRSQELNHASWVPSNATVSANASEAPDGTITADALVEDTSALSKAIYQRYVKPTTAAQYTLSAYVKQGSGARNVQIQFYSDGFAGGVSITLDFSTKSLTGPAASWGTFTAPSAGVQEIGDGWFRVYVTGTTDSDDALVSRILLWNGGATYTGNGSSSVLLWGLQLETGPHASSYIKTEGATVVRSADRPDLDVEGWLRQGAGTFYVESNFPVSSVAFPILLSLTDGTTDSTMLLYQLISAPGETRFDVKDDTVYQGGVVSTEAGLGEDLKTAVVWEDDYFTVAVNGVQGTAITSCTIPDDITTLNIGHKLGADQANGHIKRVRYWSQRRPDATLLEMTA